MRVRLKDITTLLQRVLNIFEEATKQLKNLAKIFKPAAENTRSAMPHLWRVGFFREKMLTL